jgi:5-methylthioadenosine/S-adenosylhomocysteine deaminase
MTIIYCARWVLPVSSLPVSDGALAVEGDRLVAVGARAAIAAQFPAAAVRQLGDAAIFPGLVNAHTHLELTAMRGFLEAEESDFFAWLRKLTIARTEKLTADDLYVSATWGACEAARAGITCVGDSSEAAVESLKALRDVGLRGTVFQESFGPDPRLAKENFEKLRAKVAELREYESLLIRAGVSPHAPYTVCAAQLELTADFAVADKLPLMMHAAESSAEECLIREGTGPFAESLAKRGFEWRAPGISTVQYLQRHGILRTRPLLAHCINVDDADVQTISQTRASIAHCPKSNAKLGHGRAPLAQFLNAGIAVGLGSDSVASNNTCDILEEARFALLFARAGTRIGDEAATVSAEEALSSATMGGARALGLEAQIGELKAGTQADFIAVSLSGTHQLPVYDPATALIFASSGRDVILTVVAGREVFRDGRVATVDEDRLRARMSEIAMKLTP